MAPRSPRIFDDDDPTGEGQELHDGTGIIERDDRGMARWVVVPPSRSDQTFDELRALETDALTIEGAKPKAEQKPEPKPSPQSGYNPYDTGPAKPRRKP